MDCHIQELQIAGMNCRLYLPSGYEEGGDRYPVIYVNGEVPIEGILTKLVEHGEQTDFLFLSIKPKSWNDDFTPWAAPAFRAGEEAPQGRADAYLSCLTEKIKPYMDAHYRTKTEPENTALFGYSLGGLTAVYAIYKTDVFGAIASLSGSLWFDGFCEFMERGKPLRTDLRIYVSLGKKESRSKNPRMGRVAECTARAREILAKQLEGADESGDDKNGSCLRTDRERGEGRQKTGMESKGRVCFEWNEGGHFHDIEGRFAKAVINIIKQKREICENGKTEAGKIG